MLANCFADLAHAVPMVGNKVINFKTVSMVDSQQLQPPQLIQGCLLSDCRYLCGSIEEFSAHTGLSQAFLGIIVLPIAGNACEHITAVVVAMKNKMDLALGVAVGSSIQIAIFAM